MWPEAVRQGTVDTALGDTHTFQNQGEALIKPEELRQEISQRKAGCTESPAQRTPHGRAKLAAGTGLPLTSIMQMRP